MVGWTQADDSGNPVFIQLGLTAVFDFFWVQNPKLASVFLSGPVFELQDPSRPADHLQLERIR